MGVVFPVTGHSFLPSDKVFGTTERDLRKMETVDNMDWKAETRSFVKKKSAAHHFKISQIKELVLTKMTSTSITVSGEHYYNFEIVQSLSLMKKDKGPTNINPTELVPGIKVKPSKIHDVKTLLTKHYGDQWCAIDKLKWFTEYT
ncbi:hypothetical protein PR048_013123 [Dryococelus australis]|uniref:Uncharacterized protein n=1 Tax=Dryococelus australis TaxID=614101 RepID=A0ABQ9HRA9_9NEOP|nr:hypothetical protein PR048_013123 [Dryococelus australis]